MAYYPKFGNLLNRYLYERNQIASWLAEQLDVDPSTVSRWLNGSTRPRNAEDVLRIADVLGIHDRGERKALLVAAGYDRYREQAGQAVDVPPPPQSSHKAESAAALTYAPLQVDVEFLLGSLKRLGEKLFRWSEAPAHIRSGWEGMVLYTMRVSVEQISARVLSTLLIAVAGWVITYWLLAPILHWPLDEQEMRLMACLKYAVATLAIPAVIALAIEPARYSDFHLDTRKQHGTLLLLKFTGALVAFYTFSSILIALALTWYFVWESPPTTVTKGIMVLIPPFVSYVTARRIPLDRYQMFEGKLRLHDADPLFLGVFLLAGPCTALAVYLFHETLGDKTTGVALLIVLIALAAWKVRWQAGSA